MSGAAASAVVSAGYPELNLGKVSPAWRAQRCGASFVPKPAEAQCTA